MKIIETCEDILKDFRQLLAHCRAPKVGAERIRVSLVLTIAEQCEATCLLASAGMSTHAATHARSMIEALVAIRMLESNREYVDQMRFERLRGELRVYKGIIADPDIPEELKESIRSRAEGCDTEIQSLRKQGLKPRKISDDLGASKLWQLVGPYSMLCSFSHNDLAALAYRHEGDSGMAYKQGESSEMVNAVVSIALLVLMIAIEQLGRVARFPDGHFETLFLAMNEKWSKALA